MREPATDQHPETADTTLLVCLPSFSADGLERLRTQLSAAHPGTRLLFATPEGSAGDGDSALLSWSPPPRSHTTWVLVAGDYAASVVLSQQHGAAATLVLGSDPQNLSERAVQALSRAVLNGSADIAFPRYTADPHEGLVSAAMLHPLTRTLFGAEVHLPLPLDIAFSARAGDRLGVAARRQAGIAQNALLWPVAEAAVANLRIAEVNAGPHSLPPPTDIDLTSLLSEVLGSAFADIEAKAAFWQRARVPGTAATAAATQIPSAPATNTNLDEITPMVESFRSAFTNLQQIWSLILPPHSLLALKKLSLTPAEQFRMPPSLWARTVYEFVLAFHLRTLNRGHLLGALTPLYLAWVASYLGQVDDNPEAAAAFLERNAAIFETEKPYLVSRWRWPDRFNP